MRLYHLASRKVAEHVRVRGFDSRAGLGDPVLLLPYRPKGLSDIGAEHSASSVLAVEIPEEIAREHKVQGALCTDAATDMYLVPLSVLRDSAEIQAPPGNRAAERDRGRRVHDQDD